MQANDNTVKDWGRKVKNIIKKRWRRRCNYVYAPGGAERLGENMIFYDLRMYNKCVRVCRFRFVLFSLRRKRERRRTRKKSTYDRDVNNVMTIVKRVCVAEIIWKREKQNRRAEDARERRRACLVKRTQFSSGPRCVSFAHESCVSNRIKSKRL